MAVPRKPLPLELRFSNTEARPGEDGEAEGIDAPHAVQNLVVPAMGLPHIMQKVFMFVSSFPHRIGSSG
jgi:hypothetical protein